MLSGRFILKAASEALPRLEPDGGLVGPNVEMSPADGCERGQLRHRQTCLAAVVQFHSIWAVRRRSLKLQLASTRIVTINGKLPRSANLKFPSPRV